MSTDVEKMWSALSILVNHFSHLGGAARYRDMTESDIPLYIGCQLAAAISPSFDMSQYIGSTFLESAKPVLAEVNGKIMKIEQPPEELTTLLADFVSYVEQRVNWSDRADSWCRFVEWVGAHPPNNLLQARRP